jgi:hypothetical protein
MPQTVLLRWRGPRGGGSNSGESQTLGTGVVLGEPGFDIIPNRRALMLTQVERNRLRVVLAGRSTWDEAWAIAFEVEPPVVIRLPSRMRNKTHPHFRRPKGLESARNVVCPQLVICGQFCVLDFTDEFRLNSLDFFFDVRRINERTLVGE